MAIESKRGCGYRKVGGLYLVARPEEVIRVSCDRLPLPLHVCPVCSQGIKFSRAWTWVEPVRLFEGNHPEHSGDPDLYDRTICSCEQLCPVCFPKVHFYNEWDEEPASGEYLKAGLVWIGEKYYSPESFVQELNDQGFSKRLPALPKGYKPGVTWIFTAHKKAVVDPGGDQVPGIFYAVQAPRVEKIVLKSEHDSYVLWKRLVGDNHAEAVKGDDVPDHVREFYGLEQRGIDLVAVPDEDRDHNPNYKPYEDRQLRAV